MEELFKQLFLYAAALIAYIIKGISGFGNTLIMTPLFSLFLPNKIISPIDLLFSIPINAIIVFRDRKNFSWKIVLPLSILLLIGDIPGAIFLKTGDDRILKILLSILIIGIAIEMWTRPKNVEGKKPNKYLLAFIGILSGITAGLFGISVLLVAYVSRTTSNKGQFRANLGFVFLIDNFFRLIYYSTPSVHLLTANAYRMALIYAPAVAIGMFIGIKVDKKLKDQTVHYIILSLLIVSGIILLIKNIF